MTEEPRREPTRLERWSVPVTELRTEPSMVVHPGSNRKIGYGEIAAFAKAPEKLPEIKPEDLKPAAQFRLIGRDVPRVDIADKASGKLQYASDVQVPGMLYGTLVTGPAHGAKPGSVNADELKKQPGIVDVVSFDHGVGIVAQTVPALFAARGKLMQAGRITRGRNRRVATATPLDQRDHLLEMPELLAREPRQAMDEPAAEPVRQAGAPAPFPRAVAVDLRLRLLRCLELEGGVVEQQGIEIGQSGVDPARRRPAAVPCQPRSVEWRTTRRRRWSCKRCRKPQARHISSAPSRRSRAVKPAATTCRCRWAAPAASRQPIRPRPMPALPAGQWSRCRLHMCQVARERSAMTTHKCPVMPGRATPHIRTTPR